MLAQVFKAHNKGDYVWVVSGDGQFNIPWAGKVLEKKENKVKMLTDDNEEKWIDDSSILGPLHAGIHKSVEDMITLNDLQERTLLRNILLRYKDDNIYTYIGWILISVNPYKQLPIYSEKQVVQYRDKRIGELPPHIYAVGAQSFSNVQQTGAGQCIVISGETGAGKTEAAKLLINFYASLTAKNAINKRIIKANPIIEAFGNAKTTKNDNSSRFGKYTEIFFNDNVMEAASIQYYLLEHSRVKTQNFGDRNYHVFYSMLSGLTTQEKKELQLNFTDHYSYLKNGNIIECEGRDEKAEFEDLVSAMDTLNFTKEDRWSIFQLLAAILHIGNLSYEDDEENSEACVVQASNHLDKVISLLEVNKEDFVSALTHKTIYVEGSTLVSPVTKEQASFNKDGFSMALYNHVFSHIMKSINKCISVPMAPGKPYIGILDIFGFENFTNNSFEQLCINFANEHLQQFFVQQVFKLEQEEYKKEEIEWQELEFEDNEKVLSLLGGKQINIMSLIDEQTRFPKGSDSGLLVQMNQNFVKIPVYIMPKSDAAQEFGIKHYAGVVSYKVEGFIDKNRSTLSPDWISVVEKSSNNFLKNLFRMELTNVAKPKKSTLVIGYKASLESLLKTLRSCNPFFIRCIKPNGLKKASSFNQLLTYQQLQYLGIMDTANIRRVGYPVRYSYFEFVQQFYILIPGRPAVSKIKDSKGVTKQICQKYLGHNNYQFGLTKLFLKSNHSNILEAAKNKLIVNSALIIQKHIKGYILRRRFKKLRSAALTVQRCWRGRKPRRNFLTVRNGYLRLQACIKRRSEERTFKKLRAGAAVFQVHCRGFLVRQWVSEERGKRKKRIPTKEVPILPEPTLIVDEPYFDPFPSYEEENVTVEPAPRPFVVKDDTPGLKFQQYASVYFTGNVGYQHTPKVPTKALLDLPSEIDKSAVPALWITIMRFMGDLPNGELNSQANQKSVMSQLSEILNSDHNTPNFAKALRQLQEEEKMRSVSKMVNGPNYLVNFSLRLRNKIKEEVDRSELHGLELRSSYTEWIRRRSTILEKIHFIIGHGILRPGLRDEIYCQICKQLSDNPNKVSTANGWFLMTLCVGCFPPSLQLAPTLLNFLQVNGNRHQSYVRLRNTLHNGARKQPPSYFELQALRSQTPMSVDVQIVLSENVITVPVDSATTAEEVCHSIATHMGLKDSFGFSLFIKMFGKVISLEAGSFHVMDAICQCEQFAKERGIDEANASWHMEFRKEMFAPWQGSEAPEYDPTANNLIFNQIVNFVRVGEYKCRTEFDLSMVMSQYCFINYGKKILPEVLSDAVRSVIPEPLIRQKSPGYWCKITSDTLTKSYFVKYEHSEEFVKRDMIRFAKNAWPLFLSKYYEVKQLAGIYMNSDPLLLAVNSEGICFARNTAEVILKYSYMDIMLIESRTNGDKRELHLATIQGDFFLFETHSAEAISSLVNWTIEEMKKRSKFSAAIGDYEPPDQDFLPLRKGDLVRIDGSISSSSDWRKGHLPKSGEVGEFPAGFVEVLPVYNAPSKFKMEQYVKSLEFRNSSRKAELIKTQHNLDHYGSINFKQSIDSRRKPLTGVMYKYSQNTLPVPLHSYLQSKPWSEFGSQISKAIHTYMKTPASQKKPRTNEVFELPLKHDKLRDELYCQIMKQLIENPNSDSERRGWELLWLAAGLFPCSWNLLPELKMFLSTRAKVMSQETLYRLEKTLETGSRKNLHHWIEVEAVQESLPIAHRVCFPNSMEQMFQVESSTKVGDLVEKVTEWLELAPSVGYSLIVSMDNRTISLAQNELLFDAIQDASKKLMDERDTQDPVKSLMYDLVFIRKLWLDTTPGRDEKADSICHYYQELNKYLTGAYSCSHFEAIILASFILLARKDQDEIIAKNLDRAIESLIQNDQLVPKIIREKQSAEFDFVRPIKQAYQVNSGVSSVSAQVEFLKKIENWQTFGSAFYFVTDPSSQELQKMAVNKNGIIIMTHPNGDVLYVLNYKDITRCSHTSTRFSAVSDDDVHEWITDVGYKIADLVNSYLIVNKDLINYYR